ncbi:MAG: arsenical efflux pump membrane protein ArsB, partial [candidate division NC10 bacterium]|nr:arsenical efflux pump membrane protein ArsB [candidate division NC10 bacterium]
IGSTANIVALGILERDERIHIRFGQWLAPGAVVAIPTLLLATLALSLQLPWMR